VISRFRDLVIGLIALPCARHETTESYNHEMPGRFAASMAKGAAFDQKLRGRLVVDSPTLERTL
jgi:hypothetical protein